MVSVQIADGGWYVAISNREDNEGNPSVDSVVFRWNGEKLEPFQLLETIGASAVVSFSVADSVYLAFASYTDTR